MLKTILIAALALCAAAAPAAAPAVLVVADEFPAMRVLARQLKELAGVEADLIPQTGFPGVPAALAGRRAAVVYLHKELNYTTEHSLIEFAKAGGRLIVLHHSISSGKRTNDAWFEFLGVDLAKGPPESGGYKWIEGVTLQVIQRGTNPLVASQVVWPERAAGGQAPAFTLHETEVYLNHTITRPREILLGFSYKDAKTGKAWVQDRAGWTMPAGKGRIYYFMPGHSARDFEDPAYARILANALSD